MSPGTSRITDPKRAAWHVPWHWPDLTVLRTFLKFKACHQKLYIYKLK